MSVLHYENGTLRITCTFAEGTLSGCQVTITLESGSSLSIPISRSVLPPLTAHVHYYSPLPLRSGGALEVVRYDSTTGVPSTVTAEDVGVSNPFIISGNVSTGQVSVPPDSECIGAMFTSVIHVHVHGKYVYSTLALEKYIVKEETALRKEKEAVCCYVHVCVYIVCVVQ